MSANETATRADREKAAYDEGRVFETSHGWHLRFRHVFECPNTLRHERVFECRVREAVAGRRVLELGCGDGAQAERLLAAGAGYVQGVDVSERFLAEARRREIPGRLEFAAADAARSIPGRFDVVFGRAILHHLDWRAVLARLDAENLNPGGRMLFMEPLASLPIRLYYVVAAGAHTPDERPFSGGDLRWLQSQFPGAEVLPINLVSFPAGIVSSLLLARADNLLTRWADRMDERLARGAPWLRGQFRQAIFVIPKRIH